MKKSLFDRIIIKLDYYHLLDFLSDRKYLKLMYYVTFHNKLRLNNPQAFSEKIQWLKLYQRDSIYTTMVDKNAVKNYVGSKIGMKYITPTLAVYNNISQIKIEELPNQFVLKCTHDSGGLVICRDKYNFDWEEAKHKLESAMKRSYYKSHREWPYKNIVPKIITEGYMENDSDEGLHDYKIWCFNGRAKYVQYITGRIGNITYEGFYDENWIMQPFSYHNPRMEVEIARPAQLRRLLDLASKLAIGIPFVRIDFYILPDDSIRFGEITFYPMTGMEHFHPENIDEEFGKMIDLSSAMEGEV